MPWRRLPHMTIRSVATTGDRWLDGAMRMLVVVALLASGCGPMNLAGNWQTTIGLGDGRYFDATMALTQSGATLGGAYASSALQGGISGSLAGDDVSMVWRETGYEDILITANASERSMSGKANGSGFPNTAFSANKQ